MAYLSLFLAAFLAATLLPAQSEALLSYLILQQHQPVYALIVVATLGNTLGSIVNWYLGRYLEHFQDRSWFPFKPETLHKAQQHFQKYGRWSLLLSWVPIIGDPITVVAGLMRVPFWQFTMLVALAKGGRYIVIAWLVLSHSSGF